MSQDLRHQVAEHLKFYAELGVEGVSREPAWRQQRAAGSGQPAAGSAPHSAGISGRGGPSGPPGPASAELPQPVLRVRPAQPPETMLQAPAEQLRLGESPVLTVARSPEEAIARVRDELGDCTRCKLHQAGRRQIVFGVGNPSADLMFVGEAPGFDEDVQGIPFVGRAGQKLTQIIQSIGLERDQVYIANVIKCRPPDNRNPEPDEVDTCEPFLFRQIDAIKPKVIVALGTFAARSLLKTMDPISRLRGRVYQYRGAKLVPTFHPAFLLRNPSCRREIWEDMKKVRALLNAGM